MKKLIIKIDCTIMNFFEWATSTRSALYLLIGLIVIANIAQPPSDVASLMVIVISEFYQGTALPALGVGQKLEAEKTRVLLQETHDIVIQELNEMKEIHEETKQEMIEIKQILELLRKG